MMLGLADPPPPKPTEAAPLNVEVRPRWVLGPRDPRCQGTRGQHSKGVSSKSRLQGAHLLSVPGPALEAIPSIQQEINAFAGHDAKIVEKAMECNNKLVFQCKKHMYSFAFQDSFLLPFLLRQAA